MLSERSHKHKITYCVIPFIQNVQSSGCLGLGVGMWTDYKRTRSFFGGEGDRNVLKLDNSKIKIKIKIKLDSSDGKYSDINTLKLSELYT